VVDARAHATAAGLDSQGHAHGQGETNMDVNDRRRSKRGFCVRVEWLAEVPPRGAGLGLANALLVLLAAMSDAVAQSFRLASTLSSSASKTLAHTGRQWVDDFPRSDSGLLRGLEHRGCNLHHSYLGAPRPSGAAAAVGSHLQQPRRRSARGGGLVACGVDAFCMEGKRWRLTRSAP